MTHFLNQYTTAAALPSHWEETPDGFLRVTARPLKEGVLAYDRSELANLPPELDGVNPILMLVSLDALASGETLRSLEGARVTAPDHEWVTPENFAVAKGSAAGAARINGPFQEVDMLLTDPVTIERIKNRELGELSGGYHAESIYAPGEWNGQPYHMKQVGITYNHIAVLRPGEGRAGVDVRIINAKSQEQQSIENEGGPIMVKIKLRNGKFVNVEEDAAEAIQADQEATAAEVSAEKAGSGKKLEELMKEVEELNAQIAELTAVADESKGELSVYKEKLDELLADETLEAQAAGMVEESAEADEIIENACAGMEPKKAEELKNSFQRIGNSKIHKLRGTALQTAVLNACGFSTESMSPGEIKGAFKAFKVTNKATTAKTVSGQQLFHHQTIDRTDRNTKVINAMFKKTA